ncbi:MAG: hypothetical protein IRZ16_23915, partial [Myxococcaceae bacterium]|nr:hypothetical protein [Myxococcaceae bacterium]
MRPLLLAGSLLVFGATGCVVHEHTYYRDDGYRETEPILYSYQGAHPIPAELGGGWCLVEGLHTHDYAPDYNAYAYNGTYYTYSGPTVVWYYEYHPVPTGGYCTIHGRHSHHYHPGYQYSTYYTWDATHHYYVYRDPNPGNYHPATSVPDSGNVRRPPPPGRGTYMAPPTGSYYGNRPPPPPGRSAPPPPTHSVPPPPGQGSYNPPPPPTHNVP